MDVGLFVAIAGLVVGGIAALLGVWVGWDPNKPPRYAYALSALILLSTFVSLAQAYLRAQASARMEGDIARILDDLDQLSGRDPELDRYVSEELRAQTRANPGVVNELAGRVAARGQTIETVLARRGLGAGDLEAMGFQPMERAPSP